MNVRKPSQHVAVVLRSQYKERAQTWMRVLYLHYLIAPVYTRTGNTNESILKNKKYVSSRVWRSVLERG